MNDIRGSRRGYGGIRPGWTTEDGGRHGLGLGSVAVGCGCGVSVRPGRMGRVVGVDGVGAVE